ncbi:ethanolamine utilization protein EutN [Cryobacterium frigoriphilum]|uniref:Ethanolamine utilization protein EutN n=1 Tax=Cryobacterium frigoriphilum TaxID=1259150 RepID=A0A4R8ZZT9_9MICO|nr:EutN/CcmL family microcompartment protein [Cryobacterium frigoriphilum]TFD49639.1 ethanolamine utilization protein EutN [Cryobacterium frigoriphilum]
MRLGTVVGQVVSTAKEPGLSGFTLLLIEDLDGPPAEAGSVYVAIDLVGAGDGEVVLVATGSGARVSQAAGQASVDSAVVAIADTVIRRGEITYSK